MWALNGGAEVCRNIDGDRLPAGYVHLLRPVEVRYVYVTEVAWIRACWPRRRRPPPRDLEATPYFALPDYPLDVRGVRFMEQNVIHSVPELSGQRVPATVEAPHGE
jgi:hypothetical protein